MRFAAAVAVVVLSGCVEHRTEVAVPAPPADAILATATVGGRSASAPATVRTRSALPVETDADLIERDGDGRIRRSVVRIATPTPWWQRFPADLATDLTPWTQPITATAALVAVPVDPVPADDLTASARSAGYARP
jgi:hypothetical protein